MKKSLLVTFDFPPVTGGISHSLWNFCTSFPEKSVVVLTQPSDVKIQSSFSIVRRKLLGPQYIWPRWLLLVWHMLKIARQEKVELIQAGQILPIGTAALIIKKFFHIPYVVYVYGQDLVISQGNNRKHALIQSILRQADGVIANSEFTKKLAVSLGAHEQSTVVAYPYFPRFFGSAVSRNDVDAFKKNNDLFGWQILLTVGNLVSRKGHDQVIRALTLVKRKFPTIKYIIIGKGPKEEELKKLVRDLNLLDNVVFKGKLADNELNLYYTAADMFIMPSRALKDAQGELCDVEGFGMVYLEASSFGKPVIGGNTGGIPEAIHDGKTGILVNPESINEIANAIIDLLSNPQRAQSLGDAGKQFVNEKYSTIDQANAIISLLS
ncbi:MAG: glycosyltransferase family 4 protein [Candidatus Kerfeldbacteria bacterium]|nr:glycosyltransferase family 4 protein [Candidatus Kerfeldbacteria bacterium]